MKAVNSLIHLATILLLLNLNSVLRAQEFIPAKPVGENKELTDYIADEMIYPEDALKNEIEGTVKLKFKIDKTGVVHDVQVSESVSPSIDAEAVRIFRLLLWEPASKLGYKVDSEQDFDIKFDIKKYERACKKRGYVKMPLPYEPVDTSLVVYPSSSIRELPKPLFEDKEMTLNKFITKNLVYPESAFKQDISGKVTLKFVVEPTGRISNIIIDRPVGGGCSQEAVRLAKMIRWMPGIKNNLAVRTQMSMDISFILPSDTQKQINQNGQNITQ